MTAFSFSRSGKPWHGELDDLAAAVAASVGTDSRLPASPTTSQGLVWSGTAFVSAALATTAERLTDLAIYKVLRDRGGQMTSMGSGTRALLSDAAPVTISSATGIRGCFYFDPANYAVAGRITKLRVSALVVVNATAPAATFAVTLRPITTPVGAGGTVAGTSGTAVSGSTATIATPAASSINTANSGDFDIPAAGLVALMVNTDNAMAASSDVVLRAILEIRHV